MSGKIKDAFSEIRADENLKTQTFYNIVNKKTQKKIPIAYKLIPIMAAFAVIIFSAVYYTPVSYISVDINPSIELSVNRFDRVIEVTASNEEAKDIVDSVSLNNLSYSKALETLGKDDSFLQYSDRYTEITVISEKSNEIIEKIENCSFNNQNISFHLANAEIKEQAIENDISFGKYRAYLELLEIDPNVEVEDISHLPMRIIRDMIENDGVASENTEKPYGNGNHNNQSNGNRGDGNGNKYGNGNQMGGRL